jgi:hypothetical protein
MRETRVTGDDRDGPGRFWQGTDVSTAAEERTVKARQVLMRVTSAMLMVVAAGSLEAQGNMGNTQRALRPGQNKGPTFMVPVFPRPSAALAFRWRMWCATGSE